MKRIVFAVAASLLLAPTAAAQVKSVEYIKNLRANPYQEGVFTMTHVLVYKKNGVEIPGSRREFALLVDCIHEREAGIDPDTGRLDIFQVFGAPADACKEQGFMQWWNP